MKRRMQQSQGMLNFASWRYVAYVLLVKSFQVIFGLLLFICIQWGESFLFLVNSCWKILRLIVNTFLIKNGAYKSLDIRRNHFLAIFSNFLRLFKIEMIHFGMFFSYCISLQKPNYFSSKILFPLLKKMVWIYCRRKEFKLFKSWEIRRILVTVNWKFIIIIIQ